MLTRLQKVRRRRRKSSATYNNVHRMLYDALHPLAVSRLRRAALRFVMHCGLTTEYPRKLCRRIDAVFHIH